MFKSECNVCGKVAVLYKGKCGYCIKKEDKNKSWENERYDELNFFQRMFRGAGLIILLIIILILIFIELIPYIAGVIIMLQ